MSASGQTERGDREVDELDPGKGYDEAAEPIDEEVAVEELGGLAKLVHKPLNAQIIYKAQRTTTLIPLSALREGQGENAYFVYLISQNYGGLLSGSTMTVEEMKVTLIDKSARMAAIEEDIAHREIADRADRQLSNGQAVMEYVD